jgi:sporulation protein YlmC with PRC-barrel domain
MRKISIVLSILVLSALLLAACGGEETSTSVPGGTDSPQASPVATDITATAEDMETPADTTTTPIVPVTGGEEDPARLSNQLDFTVWNQDGEQIGEVDDMVLDLDNTRISYVVVGTGGFLDLGEKKVLVPWNSLTIAAEPGAATGGALSAFILQTDQETFDNAPDVDLDAALPEMGQPANDWDADINAYWESGGATNAPSVGATTDPNMTPTTGPDTGAGQATATAGTDLGQATAAPGAGQGQVGAADLQGVLLASDLLGASIALSPGQGQGQGVGQGQATMAPGAGQATATPDTTGQPTATADTGQGSGQGVGNFNATVEDVITDIDTGDLLYLVINTTVDEGERWIPVPLSFFQWDADNEALLLNTTPATIQEAPFFEDGLFPDTAQSGWNSEFDTFWQNNTPGAGG